MQRANMGGIEQRQLLVAAQVSRVILYCLFEPNTDALSHFGRGGFRESQHQNSIEGNGRILFEQTAQASLDERASLTGTGTGYHQDIAARGDRLLLGAS